MEQVQRDTRLHKHVAKLLRLGLIDWEFLCAKTPKYEPSDSDGALSPDQLPVEDVFSAGEPLLRANAALLSNLRCYDRTAMRRWIETFRERTVRPRFPDTQQDITSADMDLLDYDDADKQLLVRNRPSLDELRANAPQSSAAHRAMRAEQNAVALRDMRQTTGFVEPLNANYTKPWFLRRSRSRGASQISDALRGEPAGSFVVVWNSDSDNRGSLAYVDSDRKLQVIGLSYSPASGYRAADVPPPPPRNQRRRRTYLSLTQLLLDRPELRWRADSPPLRGWHQVDRQTAERMLRASRPGVYVVRRSSASPQTLIVTMRDNTNRRGFSHFPLQIASGPDRFGFSAANDRFGCTTFEQYIANVERAGTQDDDDDSVLPTEPLVV